VLPGPYTYLATVNRPASVLFCQSGTPSGYTLFPPLLVRTLPRASSAPPRPAPIALAGVECHIWELKRTELLLGTKTIHRYDCTGTFASAPLVGYAHEQTRHAP